MGWKPRTEGAVALVSGLLVARQCYGHVFWGLYGGSANGGVDATGTSGEESVVFK